MTWIIGRGGRTRKPRKSVVIPLDKEKSLNADETPPAIEKVEKDQHLAAKLPRDPPIEAFADWHNSYKAYLLLSISFLRSGTSDVDESSYAIQS